MPHSGRVRGKVAVQNVCYQIKTINGKIAVGQYPMRHTEWMKGLGINSYTEHSHNTECIFNKHAPPGRRLNHISFNRVVKK